MVRYQSAFQARHGAVAVADPNAVDPIDPATQAEAPTNGGLSVPEEVVMRLRDRSSLWAIPLPKPVTPTPGTVTTQMGALLIFHSTILTDAGDQTPSMQIISQIKPEWVKFAAPSGWCREVNFDAMMKSTVERESFTVNVGTHGRDIFTRNHGEWLRKMRKRYKSLSVDLDDASDTLKVTCAKSHRELIQHRVQRRLESLQQEEICLTIPPGAKIGEFIGKSGENVLKMQSDLNVLIKNALGDDDFAQDGKLQRWIFVEGKDEQGQWNPRANPKTRVRLILKGRIKTLMPVILGRVRSALIEKCDLKACDQLVWRGDGGAADSGPGSSVLEELLSSAGTQRLMLLSGSAKPLRPTNRNEAVLHVAHAAIFDAGCVVYGGFLRDWVVRGETANDVDVRTSDYDATQRAMNTALQAFGINLSGSQPWGQNKTFRRLQYTWQGNAIDVDLVNPSLVPSTPPGVDCDVGNLQLDKHNGLQLKVPRLGQHVSLAKSVKHCMSKKFVLFYDPSGSEPAGRRLKKYIERGWICISHVPDDVASRLGLSTEQLKPKQKYLETFWKAPEM
jgi:hypothetical protein